MTTDTNTYWFRRHPKTALCLIVLLGISAVFLLAELSTRLLVPQWTPARAERALFWHYDATLGWSHRPNQDGRFVHRDFSVRVKTNSAGLRDDEYRIERTDKKRMLVLGDSFAWGFGVELADRFDKIIEQRLANWEVINAAVSGYGTDQQFLYLRDIGTAYQPDVVLLLLHENDFSTNIAAEAYWYNKPYFSLENDRLTLSNVPVPEATFLQKLDRLLLGRTFFLGRVYLRTARPVIAYFSQGPDRSDGSDDVNSETAGPLTVRLLEAIDAVCTEHGARFVLVSIPTDDDRKKAALDAFSNESDVPYLGLDEYFSTFKVAMEFPNDAHWNATGHAAASEAIANFLEEQSILTVDPD